MYTQAGDPRRVPMHTHRHACETMQRRRQGSHSLPNHATRANRGRRWRARWVEPEACLRLPNLDVFHANQAPPHHRQKPTFTFKRTVYDAQLD